MTHRIGWGDKPTSLREIAAELGFAPSAMVFIDDSAREREQVRAELPEVESLGRRPLRAAPPAARRSPPATAARHRRGGDARRSREGAAFARTPARRDAADEAAFRASLDLVSEVFAPGAQDWPRIVELFARTTQFNATGARFSVADLQAAAVLALRAKDRFADHGLVGAAVVRDGDIVGFALSCRVIGLGLEQRLLAAVVAAHAPLAARIVETPRNAPSRWLYRDGGFALGPDGVWRIAA